MKLRELVITVRIQDYDEVSMADSITDAESAIKDRLEEEGFTVETIHVSARELAA
jgi:hypothetical protein